MLSGWLVVWGGREGKGRVDVEIGKEGKGGKGGRGEVLGGVKLDVFVATFCHVLQRKGLSCGWVNSWGFI